jgi:hypothetical protein
LANIARFTINLVGSDPPGFDAVAGDVLVLELEAPSGLARRWTVQVADPDDPEAPYASLDAPLLTLVGSTSGQRVDAADPSSTIVVTLPGSGVHSWRFRSVIDGGVDGNGRPNPDFVFERVVAIRTADGRRKVVKDEKSAYAQTAFEDEQNLSTEITGSGSPGPPGPAGPVTALSVDFVVTSNDTLTGLAARDGITPVAGVTRGFFPSQTSSGQTGIYVAASGAWVRSSDLNADAQVIVGLNVYVKPGGLTGGNSNWQLAAGSTITGAKTWKRLPGVVHPPVRLVQTAPLPAYTYNTGTQLYTQTSFAAFAATVFDGIVPNVGDEVALVLEGIRNGFAKVIQLGNGSSQPNILQRRADLSASSDFANGVVFDVLDGASAFGNYKGTRWFLQTQGPITLDTTSTAWAQVIPQNFKVVDLTLPPYELQKAADAGPVLQLFSDNVDAAGVAMCGVLPRGSFYLDACVELGEHLALVSSGGVDGTRFTVNTRSGGPAMALTRGVNNPITPYGGTISSTAGAAPLSMYDTAGGTDHPWFDFTLSGLRFDNGPGSLGADPIGWPALEIVGEILIDTLNTGGSDQHLTSCRGRRTSSDAVDVLFMIYHINGGKLRAVLRLEDLTTGVYGAVTQTGTGTTVITADGALKPTDEMDIGFRVVKGGGGTIGTAGIKFQYTLDRLAAAPTWLPGPDPTNPNQVVSLGTATSYTIVDRNQNVAKFNFTAGTWDENDTAVCTTSGVHTSYTLDQAVTAATRYEFRLQYDGSTVSWYVSPMGGARATPATVSAHGKVRQKPWETTMCGVGINFGISESLLDLQPAKFNLGAIYFYDGGITTPPSTTPTSLTVGANIRFGFAPSNGAKILRRDGATVWAWKGTLTTGIGTTLIPRRANINHFPLNVYLRDFTIDSGVSRVGGGILLLCPENSGFERLKFTGGDWGMHVCGPSFFTHWRDLTFSGVKRRALTLINGHLILLGNNLFLGSEMSLIVSDGTISQSGVMFFNVEDQDRCPVVFNQLVGGSELQCVILDDENAVGSRHPREHIRAMIASGTLTIGGAIGGGTLRNSTIALAAGAGRFVAGDLICATSGPAAIRVITPSNTAPIECGPGFAVKGFAGADYPVCNIDGFVRLHRGTHPVGTVLADADATIAIPAGSGGSFVMRAGRATASRRITVTGSALPAGTTMRGRIEKQSAGVDITIANGGPAGGDLLIIPAGCVDSFGVRHGIDGNQSIVP